MAHSKSVSHCTGKSSVISEMADILIDNDDNYDESGNVENRAESDTSCINTEIYLSIIWHNGLLGLSFYDLETCQVHFLPDTPENDDFVTLKQILREIQPVVILLSSRQDNRLITCLKKLISDNSPNRTEINNERCKLEFLMNSDFNYEVGKRRILSMDLPSIPKHFTDEERKIFFSSLFTLERVNLVRSLGGLLKYLEKSRVGVELDDIETQVSVLGFRTYYIENLIYMDSATYSALNIFITELHPSVFKSGASSKEGLSLFGILNRCKSASGSRKLRYWFLRPLKNAAVLNQRFDAITFFLKSENKETVNCLTGCLKNVKYISKVLLRMSKAQATIGDWNSLFKTLYHTVSIGVICRSLPQNIAIFREIGSSFIEDLSRCTKLISKTIDFPESKMHKRLVVLPNVDDELDDKKRTYNGLSDLLNKMSYEELKSLRVDIEKCCVSYLPQVGFLLVIEMPEGKTENDDHTIEGLEFKFCSDNLVFYKTPKMTELDNILGDALVSIIDMEIKIIYNLQLIILEQTQVILDVLDKIADLDCLLALSSCAHEFSYVRPNMVQETIIEISSGRHPLQELCCSPYVPNDTNMGVEQSKMKLLTGPNACGKSIYLKQVALIVYMAHIGSFVPALSANIGPIDKIFTRIKSIESISEGMSTFLQDNMQMADAACSATCNSLVIVDEYGKGTEPTDGLALLTAVLKFWLDKGTGCPLVLVTTHFHSIIQQKLLPESKQLQFLTLETLIQNDELVFLYQIKEGHTSSSYACNIAALVGIPGPIIQRSKEVSELLCQFKPVPHMRDKRSLDQKKVHERIVEEFLKLNLDTDDLHGFLSNVVLPLVNSAGSSGKQKTGEKVTDMASFPKHRPCHSMSFRDYHSEETELIKTHSEEGNRNISKLFSGSGRNTLPGASDVGDSREQIALPPFTHNPQVTTGENLSKNNNCTTSKSPQKTAGSHLKIKAVSDEQNTIFKHKILDEDKKMIKDPSKDLILSSFENKPSENKKFKLDFSFMEHSKPEREKTVGLSSKSNTISEKKTVGSFSDINRTFTHAIQSKTSDETENLLTGRNRSSEKKQIDLRFLFQNPGKQPTIENVRNRSAVRNDRDEAHQNMTIAAIKREELSLTSPCGEELTMNRLNTSKSQWETTGAALEARDRPSSEEPEVDKSKTEKIVSKTYKNIDFSLFRNKSAENAKKIFSYSCLETKNSENLKNISSSGNVLTETLIKTFNQSSDTDIDRTLKSPIKNKLSENVKKAENLFTCGNRSSGKRTIDMRFLFQTSDKQPKLDRAAGRQAGVNDRAELCQTSTVTLEKLSQRPSYPSTCSDTVPGDSSETSDNDHGKRQSAHISTELSSSSP
ncbi:MutS protein msh5 [Bulinus truncatus]|nr:MutS protein msh5 [Bulinus truncatus]